MAVAANVLETYDSNTIREDLTDAENMITPTETPFTSMICGRKTTTNRLHEWPLVALGSVDVANRVPEGEAAPALDAPVTANRRSNYTQISDKKVEVSDTTQRIDGAADVEKLSKQIAYKLKELKRDCEAMMLENIAANPGAAEAATTRVAAGFIAFLITNPDKPGTGTFPTLSADPHGYPNANYTEGTNRSMTEALFKTALQSAWESGGEPRYVICSPNSKAHISETFTASSTRYKDADEKKLIWSVDFYESDFGQLQIIPNRFMLGQSGADAAHVLMIDPDYVDIVELQPTRQLPLARTGHSETRLIQKEYTLEVGNEAAHSAVLDTTQT